jgi:hypothetical protein
MAWSSGTPWSGVGGPRKFFQAIEEGTQAALSIV